MFRQPVTQPASGTADHLNVFGPQTDFFSQLAKHGLFGRFIPLNAALGKLPGPLPDPSRPEQAPMLVTQDDADVKPITLRVDHGGTNQVEI